MSNKVEEPTNKTHHYYGVAFNNLLWKHFENKDRSEEETLEMIHLAHNSLLHWQMYEGGTKVNEQRGYYMIAKAYMYAGEAFHAIHYAEICLKITDAHKEEMKDFDFAYAYELMAKTCTMVGDIDGAELYTMKAKEAGEAIADEKDKEYFIADFDKDWDLFSVEEV